MGIPSEVINKQFEARGPGGTRVQLGPFIEVSPVTIADTTSVQLFQTPYVATLLPDRRYACTLLLAGTGVDETEYVQWIHISVATDGVALTVTDFEILRTLLDSAIGTPVDFPFALTLGSTGLALEATLQNNSGQDVNFVALLQKESWTQPPAPV